MPAPRKAAASSTLKPRSAARTSTSWSAGAEARQRQRRVLAAGDHQVQGRWQVVEQEGDRGVDVRGAHEVVVVQDQQTGGGQGGQVVDQLGDHDLGRRRLRGVEPGQRPRPQAGAIVWQAATR